MKPTVAKWRARLYDRHHWIDSHSQFATFVMRRLSRRMRVLNLGAGGGWDGPANFEHIASCVVGLDPDTAIKTNSHLSERILGTGESLPFVNESFDLVYSDWVVEHLAEPLAVMREVFRVLRPGGAFIFRTGNLYHYVYALGAFTPHAFHKFVAARLWGEEEAVFETYYRMNTRRAIRKNLARVGFVEDAVMMIEPEPAYLMFSAPSLLVGAAYERLLNRFDSLSILRANIVASFRKPAGATGMTTVSSMINDNPAAHLTSH